MNTELSSSVNDFIAYLTYEKRASVHTIKSYQRDIGQLQHYCEGMQTLAWAALSTAQLRMYIGQRHRSGLGAKSVQRELSAIRSFYAFLLKNNCVESNPATVLRAPKAPKKLPKVLDIDQVMGLLDAQPDSILEQRDLAMFELFYSSGIRLSELTGVDLQDIDFTARFIHIRAGKGGKSRMVPVGSKALQALAQWLPQRQQKAKPHEHAVFISTRGVRMSPRNVELRLTAWCKKHGIAEAVHPHMLRHCFASHLLESSEDLRAVQELLGHSNISTTQIYTHLDFQHLAVIYDKTHPRAKKKAD
jgi:integrase/recombinase XerC